MLVPLVRQPESEPKYDPLVESESKYTPPIPDDQGEEDMALD